ncbi:superoxide dismutase [Candidatus Trichorickettsia mobilis]|uniref:superoxide dismutase n=1 Tax=Candidatus Trichorickettsia mobilis TaxID=1346319 RepID=UPI002930B9F9|nr:superoxide dismutase [Candidatus Trichorickettsia mobilis]
MIYSTHSNQNSYPFILPELPFNREDFLPHFTAETFEYHHGKHHQAYVTNLNNLLQNNQELQDKSLEELIKLTHSKNQALFNNAAQIWNHSFFWHSIKPNGGKIPGEKMLNHINKDFGSFENFVTEFKTAAVSQFGSGWAWLVCEQGKLKIIKTANADTPITQDIQPLLACDVWEHAYYVDYRNKRPDYVTTYIEHMINWEFAELNCNELLK